MKCRCADERRRAGVEIEFAHVEQLRDWDTKEPLNEGIRFQMTLEGKEI